ncbi:hypothetical protein BGY98DRAFT_1095023 [Russula aff. rugulosa BPL654]|nr:hypothetical protein BGY98DRAFT_1095023 [Russula aff. rugulosa BPL654]
MPSGMIQEAESLTSQDLCLVRIGALTIPRYNGPEIAPPRYGPPADYQRPHLPNNFVPRLPHDGYLGALQCQRREGPWAHYPLPPMHPCATCPAPSRVLPTRPPTSCTPRSWPPAATSTVQQSLRERPNREVNPGVFRMVATMNTPTVQKQFTIESDILYIDPRSRACANLDLDPSNAELGYRISSAEGPKTVPSSFDREDDHSKAMDQYGIEIKPAPKPATKCAKSRKRVREDDVPTSADPSLDGTISGQHHRLDYKDMSYWVKQNVLGKSDKYTPQCD